MILKIEIIVYWVTRPNMPPRGWNFFSKDFPEKDHVNREEKYEVHAARELLDDSNRSTQKPQILFDALILSSLMRVALGHA